VATQVITFFSIKTGILSTRVFTKSIPALGGTWFGLKEYTPTSNPIGDKVTVLGNRFIQVGYAKINFELKAIYIGSPLLAQKVPQAVQNVMSSLPMIKEQTTTALAQVPQITSTLMPNILLPYLDTSIIAVIGDNIQRGLSVAQNQVGNLVANSNPNLAMLTEGAAKTGTIWDKVTGTADNIPDTKIPTTFKIDLDSKINYVNPQTGTSALWTNTNATKHMGEYIGRFGGETASTGVRSQAMLESYQAALNQAMKEISLLAPGRYFGTYGNWEIGINTETGVVYHALMN
jgi:hypothetical protein